MTQVTLNGNEYSDDGTAARDLTNGGHRLWLLAMLSDAITDLDAVAESVVATANVSKWVSGATYPQGENVWSPTDFKTYRRKVAGAGTTDPSADPTNWERITVGTGANTFTGKQTMSGAAIDEAKGGNIASAGTINLDTATGNLVHVTGTTTIVAITLASGASRDVVFDGALTLTHGASLILPGAANITTAAGDRATFRGDGSGVVRCMHYTKASGQAVVASASGMTLLSTVTANNSATVDIEVTFDSTYDAYLIVAEAVKHAIGNSTIVGRLKVGGAYLAGGTDYEYHSQANTSGGTTYTSSASGGASTFAISGSATDGWSANIWVHHPSGVTLDKSISWEGVTGQVNGGQVARIQGAAKAKNTAALTGVRIFAGSGNITSGTFRLYGLKNS